MATLYRFGILLTSDSARRAGVSDAIADPVAPSSTTASLLLRPFRGFEVSNTGSVPVFDTLEL
jgi:hypothetical protein